MKEERKKNRTLNKCILLLLCFHTHHTTTTRFVFALFSLPPFFCCCCYCYGRYYYYLPTVLMIVEWHFNLHLKCCIIIISTVYPFRPLRSHFFHSFFRILFHIEILMIAGGDIDNTTKWQSPLSAKTVTIWKLKAKKQIIFIPRSIVQWFNPFDFVNSMRITVTMEFHQRCPNVELITLLWFVSNLCAENCAMKHRCKQTNLYDDDDDVDAAADVLWIRVIFGCPIFT